MAGYTKVNLKEDVEDQAPNFGLEGKIEARMARVPLEMEHSGQTVDREGHPEPQGRVDLDDVTVEPRALMKALRDLQLRRDVGIDSSGEP